MMEVAKKYTERKFNVSTQGNRDFDKIAFNLNLVAQKRASLVLISEDSVSKSYSFGTSNLKLIREEHPLITIGNETELSVYLTAGLVKKLANLTLEEVK